MKGKTGVNRKFTCSKCGETKTSRMFVKEPRTARGYSYDCKACHNARTKAYKKKHQGAPINRSRFLEFMGHVVRDEGDCWGWEGFHNVKSGRPQFNDIVNRQAARWITEYFYGPAPIDEKGRTYDAHHLCLNDECVNPAHIRWVSKAQHREIHRELEKEAA